MFKVIWLLARRPDITHERFRHHYETSHVPLAMKHFGHHFVAYRRNYRTETWGGSAIEVAGSGFGPQRWRYDVAAEWVLTDAAAFDTIMAALSGTKLGQVFYDDEEHFLDRGSVFLIKCDVWETPIPSGAGAAASPI